MDFEARLKQANGRLKAACVRVRIERRGYKLYLVATLPPKPDSPRLDSHQQHLALGIGANNDGLKLAEAQARKVGALLDCREFSWEPYVKSRAAAVTVGGWVEKFRDRYFQIRAETPQSLQTWKDEYQRVFNKLPADCEISVKLLEEVLLETEPDTRTRRRYSIALAALARFAGLPDKDLKILKGTYSPRSTPLRNLPSDQLISDTYAALANFSEWQWVFGVLATYGLRPHEAFHLDLSQFPVALVLKGKTGARHVRPIYPEWAEAWDLANAKRPNCNGSNIDFGNRVSHAFKRYGIPFKPYDLRHAWAIRSLKFGYDISLAAKEMGHSVDIHSSIYHAAISQDVHDEAFKKLLDNPNRLKPPEGI